MPAQYTVPPAGAPCWFDLTTPDLEASSAFYAALLGWEFSGAGPMGMGSAAVHGGRRLAGLSPQPEGQDSPAFWTLYFRVDGFDEFMAGLEKARGRPLMAVPGFDTDASVALAADSTGTAFGVLEYGDERGMGAFGTPGALAWAELFTKDMRAVEFYRTVFGWETSPLSQTEEQSYLGFALGSSSSNTADSATADGALLGGILDASALEVPAHWEAHFAVEDVDAAAAQVVELGGDVLAAPHDSFHGRVGRFVDPHLAAFTLVSFAAPESE
ncbi:VOC family protein [Brevibacterium album]|uniref:VOC family protein n=1 Tax=Brevibacterium album TaxID=417948 RepID=UPI00041C3F18|nr:VOC family protein [Brevibacterium album]